MRTLAEFVMRGRMQAALVAFVGNLVPLISPATVALVTLRRSNIEGFLILLWACLPSLVLLTLSDISPVVVTATTLASLVSAYIAAEVLRRTVSLPAALAAILVASSLATASLVLLLPADTRTLATEVERVLTAIANNDSSVEQVTLFHLLMGATAHNLGLERISVPFILGFLTWLAGMHVIASLLLGRWWQGLLFNPGGFQEEFHALRLDKPFAGLLVLGLVACNLGGGEYMTWASVLGLPLLLAGLAFIHHLVKQQELGKIWLVMLYIALVLLGPLSMVLIGVGLLDSFFDFRARLAARKGN